MHWWQTLGQYEHEVSGSQYTGWVRCVGGRLADGRWPEFHQHTGATRYSGSIRTTPSQ